MQLSHITRTACLCVGLALPVWGLAQPALSEAQARDAVAPFYDALNAASGKNPVALVLKATAPQWVSCAGNGDTCGPRDKVASGIAGFHRAIPDLKWEIKELLVSGNRVIVRGEASGTPSGPFMGVPHGGKSFRVMSLDIHTVEGGFITHSYHVEDWIGAVRQLSAQ